MFKKHPLIVSTKLKTGLKLAYTNPEKLGSDRLCNAVAAYHLYKRAVIVVDWGTATKFEVVTGKGNYLGGAITTGLGLSAFTLAQRTAQLPEIPLEYPPSVIGQNTVHCLQSGILYGMVEMTMGMLQRFRNELDTTPVIIATGGFAPIVRRQVKRIDVYNPSLVLEGARIIYERNELPRRKQRGIKNEI